MLHNNTLKVNDIYQGDCLELMKYIPDKSIDMVLCDLPYGTTNCKWDTVIPFEPLWKQYKRIVKDRGAIVLFGAQPFTSILITSNIKMFKYDWVWKKPKGTGHLNAKKQPMRDKEDILVFYKKQCTYNPQWTYGKPYSSLKSGKKSKKSKSQVYNSYLDGAEHRNGSDGRRYPKQVLNFGVVERGNFHQTQKPVDLCEYMIKTYTNEGETVLDNASGSGTTGIACIKTNRNYILIEKEKKYVDITKKRITDYKQIMEDKK